MENFERMEPVDEVSRHGFERRSTIISEDEAVCEECQGAFLKAEMTPHKEGWVCEYCRPSEIRAAAWVKMAAGGVGSLLVVAFFLFDYLTRDPGKAGAPPMFCAFIVAATLPVALTGLIEYVTGKPIARVTERWDKLASWQQYLLGAGVILVAFVVLMAGACYVATHLYARQ